ncbi:MAG: histidine kinase, partial [Clostridia bacterium]
GKMDTKLEIERNDEIGEIANSFNIMANNTQKLIKDKYELEIYNRNAQYYSLMAQINPHFINNVLQCIGAIGLEKNAVEVYDATMVLAKMLRYSIKELDVVQLKDEIDNVRDYAEIQKLRFEEKIQWKIEVDKELENISIPKLTLQPLIENSVVHGLEKKKGDGEVYLSVKKVGEVAIITIADNGIGMSAERLTELKEGIERATFDIERKRIGVSNVCHRLKIMFKDNCDIKIESKKDIGTMITIRINLE